MAWITELKAGEEIVVDDKTVIRLESGGKARIVISNIGAPPRHKIVKRRIGAADE